jgi:RNA polymerase sigma-70 factor (ECF subfamily)
MRRWGADLISRARAGDGDAFRELTEPHHRELQVHCYRMLGSFQDAEDAFQDTLLAAWQGFGGFEGRASPRTRLTSLGAVHADQRASAGHCRRSLSSSLLHARIAGLPRSTMRRCPEL